MFGEHSWTCAKDEIWDLWQVKHVVCHYAIAHGLSESVKTELTECGIQNLESVPDLFSERLIESQ